ALAETRTQTFWRKVRPRQRRRQPPVREADQWKGSGGTGRFPQTGEIPPLADDRDVERVIRGDSGVAAGLHEDAARVVGGRACPAFGRAGTGPGGGLAPLIRGVSCVSA